MAVGAATNIQTTIERTQKSHHHLEALLQGRLQEH